MVGGPPRNEVGSTKNCKFCGEEFIVGLPKEGKTFVYCPHCSYCSNSKNFGKLTPSERKIHCKVRRLYQKSYREPRTYREQQKKWRKKHPDRWKKQKECTRRRHNEETLELASNAHSRWGSDEIQLLKDKGSELTTRELAVLLGRSYNAVQVRACIEKIPLMTEDKKHGRLVTGKPSGSPPKY